MKELDAQRKRLDALFEKASDLSNDAELLSHWAKYLCVLVCGFLENSVEMCLAEYCKKRGDENINNFVSTELRSFQNPRMGKIVELFGSFSKTWEEDLKNESAGRISDAVNSIVANRHMIAHGGTSQLAMSSLKGYYADVVRAVEIMRRICGVGNAK
jgi:RiboL-PSP-HEPN